MGPPPAEKHRVVLAVPFVLAANTIGSFLKKTTVWEEIRHTRNVAPEALIP